MIFPTDELNDISKSLISANETVATAESVTSGFLQFLFSQMVDASKIYKGGLTAYTLQEKVNLLKIDEKEAKNYDCVSAGIAAGMARHASALFKTEWGIAVTGYATPVKESNFNLFAFFSFAYRNNIIHEEKIALDQGLEGPAAQIQYGELIIKTFKNIIAKQPMS